MKLTKLLSYLIVLTASFRVVAQSQYQFTQFNLNPIFMNPAQTGAYEGTYRVGGIFRSQWNSTNPYYKPMTGYVDAPILMVAKRHWVGLGLMYARDEAGQHNLGTRIVSLSASFHYSLDKKFRNVLTFGAQFGGASIGLNSPTKDGFYSQLASPSSQGSDPWASLKDQKTSYTDVNIGFLFKSVLDKKSKLSVGLILAHLTQPNSSLKSSGNIKLPVYTGLTMGYDRKLNNKLSIHPTILIHRQTKSFTANPQAMIGYKMPMKGQKEPITLKGGLGYDMNGHAANVLAGVDIKLITVGLAYDLNVGSLRNAAKDGIEIAVQYVGKIYKEPKVKGVMVCPKY